MNQELPPMSRAAHDVLDAYPKPSLGPVRRAAMRNELDAAVAAGSPTSVHDGPPPAPSAGAGLATRPWLWVVLGAVVVLGGGLGVVASERTAPPRRAPVVGVTPTPPVEPATSTDPAPAVLEPTSPPKPNMDPPAPKHAPPSEPTQDVNDPRPRPTAAPAARTNKKSKPASVSTAAEEARLLQRAQTALRDGRVTEALAVVQEHERRFPSGKLVEARESVRAVAECERQPARRTHHRDAFLSQFPGSAFTSRVRTACASSP